MNETRLLGFLGLLNCGGRLIIGETLTYSLAKVKLVLLASDAKENTLKQFHDKCANKGVETLTLLDKEKLGQAIGFSSIAAIGVRDKKACDKIKLLVQEESNETK